LIIAHTVKDLQSFLASKSSAQIGFVPTMGALHQGHLSLVTQAKAYCELVVVSIFVNPLQFNDPADFTKYPKVPDADAQLLRAIDCDLLFLPTYEEIYPSDFTKVQLDLAGLDAVLEGKSRVGHFDGVVQVLHRLFSIVQPHHAFFGLKDYQQCLVVKKLCSSHFTTLNLHFLPTQRADSGLALSSRNARLSDNGVKRAEKIAESLFGVRSLMSGYSPAETLAAIHEKLTPYVDSIDYLVIAETETLSPINTWESGKNYIILTAVYIEKVRLIDNFDFQYP
jgi:pantoate--beta-alanine ligase